MNTQMLFASEGGTHAYLPVRVGMAIVVFAAMSIGNAAAAPESHLLGLMQGKVDDGGRSDSKETSRARRCEPSRCGQPTTGLHVPCAGEPHRAEPRRRVPDPVQSRCRPGRTIARHPAARGSWRASPAVSSRSNGSRLPATLRSGGTPRRSRRRMCVTSLRYRRGSRSTSNLPRKERGSCSGTTAFATESCGRRRSCGLHMRGSACSGGSKPPVGARRSRPGDPVRVLT